MQSLSKWGNFTTAAAAATNGTTANKTVQVHIGPSHEATTSHAITPIGSGVKQNRKKSKRNSKRKPKKRKPKKRTPKRKPSKKGKKCKSC